MITVNLTMHQLAVLIRELRPEEVRAFSETNPAKTQPLAWNKAETPADVINEQTKVFYSGARGHGKTFAQAEVRYREALKALGTHSEYHNSLNSAFTERDDARKLNDKYCDVIIGLTNERDALKQQVENQKNEWTANQETIDRLGQEVIEAQRLQSRALEQLKFAQDEGNKARKLLTEIRTISRLGPTEKRKSFAEVVSAINELLSN